MPVSTRKHYPIQTMNRSHFAFTRHAPRAQGFSLVEMAMVLLVVGVLAALFLPATNTMMDNNRRKETRTKLEALESAITRFVMTRGRLPCPADGGLAPGANLYGVEGRIGQLCGSLNAAAQDQRRGVVPWVSLGLSINEATDAWGNLITYRVWAQTQSLPLNTSLARDNGMNMSVCDPAGNDPAGTDPVSSEVFVCLKNTAATPPTYTKPLNWLTADTGRGFRACDAAPSCVPGSAAELASKANGNGIAYFLISHGANKFNAFNPNGNLVPVNGPGPGLRENINSNGLDVRTASTDDFYVDADLTEDPANYYDDIVLRPTVMKVALDAGLGPRVP